MCRASNRTFEVLKADGQLDDPVEVPASNRTFEVLKGAEVEVTGTAYSNL